MRSIMFWGAAAIAATILASPGRAQSAADSAGIRAAASDYIEGWYAGDAERMARSLHPELVKRIVQEDETSGGSELGQMGKDQLVGYTRQGGGRRTPESDRRSEVRILDIFENMAVVRVDARDWVDHLQIAKWNDRWLIVNVLWAMRPS